MEGHPAEPGPDPNRMGALPRQWGRSLGKHDDCHDYCAAIRTRVSSVLLLAMKCAWHHSPWGFQDPPHAPFTRNFSRPCQIGSADPSSHSVEVFLPQEAPWFFTTRCDVRPGKFSLLLPRSLSDIVIVHWMWQVQPARILLDLARRGRWARIRPTESPHCAEHNYLRRRVRTEQRLPGGIPSGSTGRHQRFACARPTLHAGPAADAGQRLSG
eukprot:SAG22_NODE_23_length_31399_cov_35.631313_23_plen_212_part_00